MPWQPPFAPTVPDEQPSLGVLDLLRQLAANTPANPLAGSIKFGPSQWQMPPAPDFLGNTPVPQGPAVPMGPPPGVVLPAAMPTATPSPPPAPAAIPAVASGAPDPGYPGLMTLLQSAVSPSSALGGYLGSRAQPAAPASPTSFSLPGTPGASGPQSFTIKAPSGAPAPFDVASYIPKMYHVESGGKMVPNAAGASSAKGFAQFTEGTWKDAVKELDPDMYNALDGKKDAILRLRDDPAYHDKIARGWTAANANILGEKGLPVNDANVYGMHFFGRGAGPAVLAADANVSLDRIAPEAVAANPQLRGMNAGQAREWLASKMGGAASAMPGAPSTPGNMPGVPSLSAPNLPVPPAVTPRVGLDPAAYDKFNALTVLRQAPMSTSDRITNVLAGMAQGAQGGKSVADVLLGAGGGAAGAAGANVQRARGEEAQSLAKQMELQRLKAGVGVQQAQAVQQGQNFKVDAGMPLKQPGRLPRRSRKNSIRRCGISWLSSAMNWI
jgi:hypothetical protein